MKQIISFIAVFAVSLIAMSCGKFSDGTSVWQAGLWIIPWVTGLGALWTLYRAYRASRSGSWRWVKKDKVWFKEESDINVPIYKVPQFVWFVILAVATIVIIIMVNSDK